MEKRVVTAHQPEDGYKTISKRFQLYPSTAKQIIYKLRAFNMTATRPRSGRPSKLSTRSTTKILNQIKGNQHITSRVLQTFFGRIWDKSKCGYTQAEFEEPCHSQEVCRRKRPSGTPFSETNNSLWDVWPIKNQHTWRKEPSPNREVWWWRCDGLLLHLNLSILSKEPWLVQVSIKVLPSVREVKPGRVWIMYQNNDRTPSHQTTAGLVL